MKRKEKVACLRGGIEATHRKGKKKKKKKIQNKKEEVKGGKDKDKPTNGG
jgi:hypothetical protein